MTIALKDTVIITGQPGIEHKYPMFAKGFLGLKAIVIGIKDLIEVQTDEKDPSQRVWIKRDWLTQERT